MTMPHLSNCPHSEDSWCLECVAELHQKKEEAIKANIDMKESIQYLLDSTPNAVRACYKSGPERLIDSLSITFIGMRDKLNPALSKNLAHLGKSDDQSNPDVGTVEPDYQVVLDNKADPANVRLQDASPAGGIVLSDYELRVLPTLPGVLEALADHHSMQETMASAIGEPFIDCANNHRDRYLVLREKARQINLEWES